MQYAKLFRPLFRRRAKFAAYLPWSELIDVEQGIMTTTDDGVMSTFAIDPKDLGSMGEAERAAVMCRISTAFQPADHSWAFWQHGRHREVVDYPVSDWPDPVSALIDEEHCAAMTAPGRRWNMQVYLTAWHRALSKESLWAERLFFHDEDTPVDVRATLLKTFRAGLEQLTTLLAPACHEIVRLNGQQLLTYLHRFISIYDDQEVALPSVLTDIAYRIVDCKTWPGTRLTLGPHKDCRQYIRALTLTEDLPPETKAVMWPDLFKMPIPYDWSTRIVPMQVDETDDKATTQQLNLDSMSKGGKVMVYEWVTHKATGREFEDEYSRDQVKEAGALRSLVRSGKEGSVHQTTTFLTRSFDPKESDEHINMLANLLRRYGCVVVDEGLNCTEAYFGANPGQMHTGWRPMPNPRKLVFTTMNFAHTGCWWKPYTGEPSMPRVQAPALTQALTEDCHVFQLSPYVGDVGDLKKVGPRGSGKSTEMNWEAAQWGRVPDSMLFTFDWGGSAECMTRCLGGLYQDILRDGMCIQLLAYLDDDAERRWIQQWMLNRIYAYPEVKPHPDIDQLVWDELETLRRQPELPRSLLSFLNVHMDHAKQIVRYGGAHPNDRSVQLARVCPLIDGALRPFAQGGPFGHMVDAPEDRFNSIRLQTFELLGLSQVPRAYPGVCEALYHRILGACHGQPVRLHWDEASHAARNQTIINMLLELLPWTRRNNVSLAFAFQAIGQYANTPMEPLLAQFPTNHYFPDPTALSSSPTLDKLWAGEGLDLNDRETIARATPKVDVFVVKEPEGLRQHGGKRLVSLPLQPIARDVCGSNSKEDHALMDQLLNDYPGEEMPFRFLDAKGHTDAAKKVRQALALRSLDAPLPPVLEFVAD